LIRQRRKGRFDHVHLVTRAWRAGCQVGDSGGAGEFEDEMLAAVAEACGRELVQFSVQKTGKRRLWRTLTGWSGR
jgi:hypothetical protein